MFGLDRLGVSTGGSDENGWTFYIDSDIWRFQDVQDVADCVRIRREWIEEATAEGARRWTGATNPAQENDVPVPGISDTADPAGHDGLPALAIITRLLRRFPAVVRELEHRHDRRSPMAEIRDEYDVQDLLRSILAGLFDDVRDEEPTPSHGGLASRMDLLLKSEQIVIETKMTRASLSQRKVAEELATDKELYRSHPGCRTLVCFVYDPGRHLRRPASLEADLSDLDGPVPTIVIVAPLD